MRSTRRPRYPDRTNRAATCPRRASARPSDDVSLQVRSLLGVAAERARRGNGYVVVLTVAMILVCLWLTTDSIAKRRDLSSYCLYFDESWRKMCDGAARHVLQRPSGETLAFSCDVQLPEWGTKIRGPLRRGGSRDVASKGGWFSRVPPRRLGWG